MRDKSWMEKLDCSIRSINGFQSALVRNRKGGVDAKTKLSQADEVGKI